MTLVPTTSSRQVLSVVGKLDESTYKTLCLAGEKARRSGSSSVEVDHLFLSIVGVRLDSVSAILAELQVPLAFVVEGARRRVGLPIVPTSAEFEPATRVKTAPFVNGMAAAARPGSSIAMSSSLERVMQLAGEKVGPRRGKKVDSVDMLAAICEIPNGPLAKQNYFLGVTSTDIRKAKAVVSAGQ